ncbi:MAG: hypothetical protein ACQEQV_09330 [Fibrobacterota bacterium]
MTKTAQTLGVLLLLLSAGCSLTGRSGDTGGRTTQEDPVRDSLPADSLTMTVRFQDSAARKEFQSLLQEYLPAYFSSLLKKDSLYLSLAERDSLNRRDDTGFITLDSTDRPADTADTTTHEPARVSFDPAASLTVLTPFHTPFTTFSQLSAPSDSAADSLIQISRTETRRTLTVSQSLLGTGNAIELISQWNRIFTDEPALAQALLGPLEGLNESGSSRIQGITPASQNVLELRYSTEAHSTLHPALIAHLPGFSAKYHSRRKKDGTTEFTIADTSAKPYCAGLSLLPQEDLDPVIALSMNRADGAVVYQSENIETIRRRLPATRIFPLDRELVFVSLSANTPAEDRQIIRKNLDPAMILSQLSARGNLRPSLRSDSARVPRPVVQTFLTTPSAPVAIIYPPGNPLAASTASAIAFQLHQRGIETSVQSSSDRFSRRLQEQDFTLAVGAVRASFMETAGADDFIGSYWCNTTSPEEERILSFRQVNLFAIPLYLALQNNANLPVQGITEIHRLKE